MPATPDLDPIGASDVQNMLADLLDGYGCDLAENVKSVHTFADTGLMTRDNGVLVRMNDGSKFQVTVVKSR